jgi:hypothetical protein
MTSLQAQAARAKSAEVMAALKKGEPGDADKLLVSFRLVLREWMDCGGVDRCRRALAGSRTTVLFLEWGG